MNKEEAKAAKRDTAVKALDRLMDDIKSVMEGDRSPYVKARGLIKKVRETIVSDPERALRCMMKAEALVTKESALARRAVNIEALASNNDANMSPMKKYKKAIDKGNLKAAERAIVKMEKMLSSKNIQEMLSISLSSYRIEEGKVEMILNNVTDHSIQISSVSCASQDAETSVMKLATNIPRKGQTVYPMNVTANSDSVILNVTVYYMVGSNEMVQRRSFKVRPE